MGENRSTMVNFRFVIVGDDVSGYFVVINDIRMGPALRRNYRALYGYMRTYGSRFVVSNGTWVTR